LRGLAERQGQSAVGIRPQCLHWTAPRIFAPHLGQQSNAI
jgi:hypothetical protein